MPRPDWQETITNGVAQAEGKRRRPVLAFNVDVGLRLMMGAAAELRGMSPSAYARRALCAFIAKDLGLPFESVTKFCPSVEDPENLGAKQGKASAVRTKSGGKIYRGGKIPLTRDDGVGYGSWVVCDG